MEIFKKIFTLIVILVCSSAVVITGWCVVCFNEFSTLLSYTTIETTNQTYYSVSVEGDYYMSNFIEKKGAHSNTDMTNFLNHYTSRGLFSLSSFDVKTPKFDTTNFTFKDEFNYIGSTYSSSDNLMMMVKTSPQNKYTSISTVNLAAIGITDELSLKQKMYTPAVAYFPIDGMNEKGLTASISYTTPITNDIRYYNSVDPDITENVLLRLILDNAATIDEAIHIVNSYDLYLSDEMLFSITLTDSFGNAAKIYTEESVYINENLLMLRVEIIDINQNHTVDSALSVLNSFTSVNTEYSNNYSVLYNKTNKEATYYLDETEKITITL